MDWTRIRRVFRIGSFRPDPSREVEHELAARHWIEPLLFEVSASDPQIMLAVGGLLVLVSLVATVRPALRAATVDPMTVLRVD